MDVFQFRAQRADGSQIRRGATIRATWTRTTTARNRRTDVLCMNKGMPGSYTSTSLLPILTHIRIHTAPPTVTRTWILRYVLNAHLIFAAITLDNTIKSSCK